MTPKEQRALATNFINQVKEALLMKADKWPEHWDGHEIRELVAYAFEFERTALMRTPRSKRRKDCRNDILVNNLY